MTYLWLIVLTFGLCTTAHQKRTDGTPTKTLEPNQDYLDYSEDEEASPGNIVATTVALPPYFEKEEVVVSIKPNASAVKLDCPIKNYDASHHAILWYKNDIPITNGNKAFSSIYSVDNQFALTIAPPPLSNETTTRFSCHAMPSNVRHQIILRTGEQLNEAGSNAPTCWNWHWHVFINLPMILHLTISNF